MDITSLVREQVLRVVKIAIKNEVKRGKTREEIIEEFKKQPQMMESFKIMGMSEQELLSFIAENMVELEGKE